jgi:hypothetical protein
MVMIRDEPSLLYFCISEAENCEPRETPGARQGCQIFLDTIYQKGEKYTKLPNGHKIYQSAVRYPMWQ